MPLIQLRVDSDTKAAFADLARRNGLRESDLLRRAVKQLLGQNPLGTPAQVEDRRGSRRVTVRLWRDEYVAVERMADAEARSVPAWIAALVRRTAMDVTPFNPSELEKLHQSITALGPLGRNLNTLVRHWHQTGRASSDSVDMAAVSTAIADLRRQVIDLADRASNRYTAPVIARAGDVDGAGESAS